jgi:16S rRNA (guanine966-N2)-methyltransferase
VGEQRVRIVAGRWRGRTLRAPRGQATRPTSDRVREALFSSLVSLLGPDLGGAAVLDAFAGSGALGLEALSRGAARAGFIESEAAARAVLAANIVALDAGALATVVPGDAFSAASRAVVSAAGPFALLLLDPPYRISSAQVAGLVTALAGEGSLTSDAVVAYEHASATDPAAPDAFAIVRTRRYGSTSVTIMRRFPPTTETT